MTTVVDLRFLQLVLELIGEKDMRDWLLAHVRFGRLCRRCEDLLPPQEASLVNARLEKHEDQVGLALDVAEMDADVAAHFWAADNHDSLAELNLLPPQ